MVEPISNNKATQNAGEPPESLENTVRKILGPVLFKCLGFERLGRLYRDAASRKSDESFCEAILRQMNVDVQVSPESLEAIPKTGPVVVIANHPFGGIEGLVLVQLLSEVRKDVKVLVNFILNHIPEIRDFFLCVDPFGNKDSVSKNVAPLRETLGWLKKGGVLAVFPAGTVSHIHVRQRQITDPVWSKSIAGIIRRTDACVIPIYFHGRNSILFQILGLLHPKLRTLMLGRELINKCNRGIALEIGSPISNKRLKEFSSDENMMAYLRLRTFILRYRANAPWVVAGKKKRKQWAPVPKEPIAPPVEPELICSEIDSLPADQLLAETENISVFYASASQIPNALREIGRLREVTFREVNEGTGLSIDLDKYDQYYLHLFSWNKNEKCITGAYRLGQADKILKEHGISGLYTHSLFRYSPELLHQLGPSLEVGRSFVRAEEQKNFFSLFMLWKGIGHYVAKNPQYRNLFGPVSISEEYDVVSRQLIMSYLREHNFLPELAKHLRPRKSPRTKAIHGVEQKTLSTVVSDLNDVSQIISEIESQEKAVPVLLKQYLKMGGKLLGFNVDPHFGNVLDGLILVDLAETKPRVLKRYVGDGTKSFLAYHGKTMEDAGNTNNE